MNSSGPTKNMNDRDLRGQKVLLFSLRFFFSLASFFLLFFFLGGREEHVGVDTPQYYLIYDYINHKSSSFTDGRWEPLYKLLNIITYKLGLDAKYVILFSSFISILFIYLFIIESNSKISLLAILLYVGIYGYLFSFNLLRLSISIPFFLLSIVYNTKGRKRKSLIYCFLSIGFHYSSIVAYIIYYFFLVLNKSKKWEYYLALIWLLSILSLLYPPISIILLDYIGAIINPILGSYYSSYTLQDNIREWGFGLRFILNQFIFVLLFLTLTYGKWKISDLEKKIIYLSSLGIIIFNFTINLGYLNRLSNFFSLATIVGLPIAINCLMKGYPRIIARLVLIILIILFFIRALEIGSYRIKPYGNWILNKFTTISYLDRRSEQ